MSGSRVSNSWDEIWAEFDARQPAVARPTARTRRPPRGARPRKATWGRGLAASILAAFLVLYLASPVAAALHLAAAIQRGDTGALAGEIDWEALRPGLMEALSTRARDREPHSMPAFIADMAGDMAARLAEPEALTALLNRHLAHGGPARDLLGRVRIQNAGIWEIELSPPNAPPRRAARLTLALADPWRLRWEVRGIELPSDAGR